MKSDTRALSWRSAPDTVECTSLPACIRSDCRIVILGSMPGQASLSARRYYAHPRNRFWPLVAELFDVDLAGSYDAHMDCLQRQKIGLWDVLHSCQRRGSLDHAIVRQSARANPLFRQCVGLTGLRAIVLNGAKAAQTFKRYLIDVPEMKAVLSTVALHALPSTSPANTLFNERRLREAWTVLRQYI